jgi:DNA polymerase-3 subunit gamma/tau
MNDSVTPSPSPPLPSKGEYIVVARRYRPQTFTDLVGQSQVAQALTNAITTNRVGHAYLFTGARGVGKTSTARILAKALNCSSGPTTTPCNSCDACETIALGEDVDVLEIDGASNRGIDEIRQLRSNVNIRPSRSRFKIYIIDEVHMLTTPAFNALLKTLEEPPEHVKFIFCTTDPEKIPITVLSRCQRFDFPPVQADAIVERLRFILEAEGMTAEEEVLQLLARRAAGSMRDSQSLLEQLLSFCEGHLTTADVHTMLGTAPAGRLAEIVQHLIARDAASALADVEAAVGEGIDVGQLAEQLLGYFRDMMAAQVGCEADLMLHSAPADYVGLRDAGQQMGLQTILAVVQIIDQAVTRMRQSTHVRTLLEVALVQISALDELDDLAAVIQQLQSGSIATSPSSGASTRQPAKRPAAGEVQLQKINDPAQKKTEKRADPTPDDPPKSQNFSELDAASAESVWKQALSQIEDMTADYGSFYDHVAISAPNCLVVSFKIGYTLQKESLERPERRATVEQALASVTGKRVKVQFELLPDDESAKETARPVASLRQLRRDVEKNAMVHAAIELFDAEIDRIDRPRAAERDKR